MFLKGPQPINIFKGRPAFCDNCKCEEFEDIQIDRLHLSNFPGVGESVVVRAKCSNCRFPIMINRMLESPVHGEKMMKELENE